MKNCKRCGKELTINQYHNTFCGQKCAALFKKEEYLSNWKNGTESGNRQNGQISNYVRNYLLENREYKCERCGWGEINPVTNKVPLEIHHKDGNYKNNSEDNLEVLCPNCHSLTPNFKALNTTGRENRASSRKNYCVDCGASISAAALRCRECENKKRIIKKPVTREELKDLIRKKPFTAIGKDYGVTDNAVRKWCISYGLPSRVKDIKAYSEEEWSKI